MYNARRDFRTASYVYHNSWKHLHSSFSTQRGGPAILQPQKPWKPLPYWVWRVLSAILSFPLPNQKQLNIGTCLYLFTLIWTAVYTVSAFLLLFFDVFCKKTKSTILTGVTNCILGFCWVSVAAYANHLGYKIFTTKCLYDKVHLHSKSIFHVNCTYLLLLLEIGSLGIHLYVDYPYSLTKTDRCKLLEISSLLCKLTYLSNIVYGIMVILWNSIVGLALLSICRTHTIGCRRFVQELEFEGLIMEKLYSLAIQERIQQNEEIITYPNYEDDEEEEEKGFLNDAVPSDFMAAVESADIDSYKHPQNVCIPKTADWRRDSSNSALLQTPINQVEVDLSFGDTSDHQEDEPTIQTAQSSNSPDMTMGPMEYRLPHSRQKDVRGIMFYNLMKRGVTEKAPYENLLLHSDEIDVRLWKIICNLRITSLVFERWMMTWLAFIILWTFTYIIYWLNHKTLLEQFVDFLMPLTLLFVITSAYGEVNLECVRISRTLFPRSDRLSVNRFLISNPPSLTVFNIPLTYSVIGGLLLAFTLALSSRMVMDEFSKK